MYGGIYIQYRSHFRTYLIGFLILLVVWSRSWLLRGPRQTRILVSDTTKRCLQSPEDQDEDRGSTGRLTSANLITQGSRLHGSSRLYNTGLIGCEGAHFYNAGLIGCEGAHFYNTGLMGCEGARFYNTGLIGCEGEFVDAALSRGVQLVTQRPPADDTPRPLGVESPALLFDGKGASFIPFRVGLSAATISVHRARPGDSHSTFVPGYCVFADR
jgi:hypothetical protein